MQGIEELLREIKQTGEGSWELKIEDTVYERRFFRPERLIILGGGHVGQAISKFASAVGFYVIVVDDRPSFANRSCFPDAEEIYCEEFEKALDMLQIGSNDYVTVVTRGHRFDLTCLRKVLKGIFPRYLGMMGSKRRVAGIIDLLQEEGNAAETVAKIHMPIGLNIGALTVPEIAISIVAELIEERRSIRKYDSSRRATKEQITAMVQAAIQAPSWKNSQTARYYAILEEAKCEEFSESCLPQFNRDSSKGASYLVTTFVKNRAGYNRETGAPDNECGNGWGYYDLGLQNENLILKAKELGLDTLIMGIRDAEKIHEMLQIPETEQVVAVIAVGYRDIDPEKPKRKTPEAILTFVEG